MIERVRTVFQLDELDTDGHSPVTFICSDADDKVSVYYVKYRSDKSFKKDEIQFLVFELLCSELLLALNIPTPETALVEVTAGALIPSALKHNKRYLKPGVIAFGSKEIEGADIVKKIEVILNKKEYNKFHNPQDLIKIAIFDLWVENMDRHQGNLNMLISSVDKKLQFNAIDHGFTFGGPRGMATFGPMIPISTFDKLITSQYFMYVIKHISVDERLDIANNFISFIRETDVQHIVNYVFRTIPETWEIRSQLEGRVIAFLTSEHRLSRIQQIAMTELSKTIKVTS